MNNPPPSDILAPTIRGEPQHDALGPTPGLLYASNTAMNTSPSQDSDRRPLKSRAIPIFQTIAAGLVRWRVSPNAISCVSVLVALVAGFLLAATRLANDAWTVRICWIASAAMIQLRLLANMLDGMVAIEGGRGTATGPVFNEVPDRISDPMIIIGAGYALGGSVELGYVAAVMALFVAYIRSIGAELGAGQAFHGPMAKPHRMFTLTVASLYCGLAPLAWQPTQATTGMSVMACMLALIILGCVVTAARRLRYITTYLRHRKDNQPR
ncbi:MAG: CDP-alcohol phosphatidyltransferase family protein [Phycisphaera sp.]|nr:CDP-alcohol phosphatidyltransferase family protein [Phycisphaera sp.]